MGEANQKEVKSEVKKEEANKEEKQEGTKKEEKQGEEKKDPDNAEEKKEERSPSPPPPLVLSMDLHCVGCAKKIERSILKCKGVEAVEIDMGKNQVMVKGIVDIQQICSSIQGRTMRQPKVISLVRPAEGEVSGVLRTVELRVDMHCEGCAQQLRKKILRMGGVQTVETVLSSGKVMVTGTTDPNRIVKYVYSRTRKQAKIIPQPPTEREEDVNDNTKAEEQKPPVEKKDENKENNININGGEKKKEEDTGAPPEEKREEKPPAAANDGEEHGDDTMKKMMYWAPLYVVEQIPPPPQLFSDENPNACCIS